jgi:hypothetical protein
VSAENVFAVTNGAVLDFIKSAPDLSQVTFVIYQDANSSNAGDAWASREDSTASHWPMLTLSTSVTPPPANTNPFGFTWWVNSILLCFEVQDFGLGCSCVDKS